MGAALSWSSILGDRSGWIDVTALVLLSTIHVMAWWGVGRFQPTKEARQVAADSFRSSAGAGLTAVGILIPITLLTIQLGRSSGSTLPAGALLDVFIADLWFTISLLLGLFVVWVTAVKVATQNVLNRKDVGIAYGLQLMFLFVGAVRLLIAVAAMTGGG